jgi:hypothetical protein
MEFFIWKKNGPTQNTDEKLQIKVIDAFKYTYIL